MSTAQPGLGACIGKFTVSRASRGVRPSKSTNCFPCSCVAGSDLFCPLFCAPVDVVKANKSKIEMIFAVGRMVYPFREVDCTTHHTPVSMSVEIREEKSA